MAPTIEQSYRSLVSIGTSLLSVMWPASTAQRIAHQELTLPHLKNLNCMLNLDTFTDFTDLKNMLEAIWPKGEDSHSGHVRGVFHSECKITSRNAAREFGRWEEEMRVLFARLSIDGQVEFLRGRRR